MSTTSRSHGVVPTTQNCRFCWMCRQACPVGHVSHRETYTPHAWALTIESVKRGQLTWNQEAVDVLYACADCGLCQAHCATDQPLPDAIAATRTDVVAAGAAPAAVRALNEKLCVDGSPYGKSGPRAPAEKANVVVFVGDAGHFLSPKSVDAAVGLLASVGVRAAKVGAGRSTGAAAASLGLRETAIRLARTLLEDIAATSATEVLVLTPGDRWAFEHVYPERLGLTGPHGVVIRDVVSVLGDALAAGTLKLGAASDAPAWTYHDPCHSVRVPRDSAAPRRLLEAALGRPGQKMFWREQRAHPCGATSGLEFTHPGLAADLADARLADALASGARQLVTDDPLCLHHLKGRGSRDVEVVGLYEVLAERIL